MTREEAIAFFKDMNECTYGNLEAVEMAIKALEQETVSKETYDHEYFLRKKMEAEIDHLRRYISKLETQITLEQEPKIGHCKDCKWWKDKDGVYRRGCRAESKCTINRREVFEGNGYCYMFEPQESEG